MNVLLILLRINLKLKCYSHKIITLTLALLIYCSRNFLRDAQFIDIFRSSHGIS